MKKASLAFLVLAPAIGVHGEILFEEKFEDTAFESRGWYDSPRGDLSSEEHIDGSTRCFECFFAQGERGCSGGTPGRRLFSGTATVYLSYWVKYSANYVGSNRPNHPHEFHFVTTEDDRWVGPAFTRLTTYTEQVGGVVRIALQDSRNVDLNCVLLNDGSFAGCGGDFDSYRFTEERSACACNGLEGDLDGRDCFSIGDGTYYSARFWDSDGRMFVDEPGPYCKNDWHFIECLFELNSIEEGIGQSDGVIRYWYDGELVLDYSRILFRTGAHPDMTFNQFLIAPYIGDGSPVDQYMWVDDLTVATQRPPAATRRPRLSGGRDNCQKIFITTQPGTGFCRIPYSRHAAGIFSISGKNVWHCEFDGARCSAPAGPLSRFPAGVYIVVSRTAVSVPSAGTKGSIR